MPFAETFGFWSFLLVCSGSPALQVSSLAGSVKAFRTSIYAAATVLGVCALWATIAWYTGAGISIFMAPGDPLAELFFPLTREPYLAHSVGSPAEAVAQLVVARGLERGLQVWWCSVVFWLTVPPLAAFLGVWYSRRHRA
jgi:hypothetical protein